MKLFVAIILAVIFAVNLTNCAVPKNRAAGGLKLCSFNVQIFGTNKASNDVVMKILGQIFARYDLCMMQEIRDTKDESTQSLLAMINAAGKAAGKNYKLAISERLGRTNSKEQYAFFYDANKISVTEEYQYDDKKDMFQRPPFLVRFKTNGSVKDFFIGAIHTEPESADEEIASLVDVYDAGVKKFKTSEGIIMGDFNAGCSYWPKYKRVQNRLRTDQRFLWLIGDDINTTVGKADCPYDRVVVAGSNLQKRVGNAQTFYYDADKDFKKYKIDSELAKLVSDHYPIEFEIA